MQLGQKHIKIPYRKNDARDKLDGEESDDYISSDEDETAAENWEPLPHRSDLKGIFISAKRK